MSFNFSSENNEFNEPSNDNSNKKNNSENLIDQASQEELESKIKIYPFLKTSLETRP